MSERLFIRIIQNKSNTHQAAIVNESGQVIQEKTDISRKDLQKMASKKELVLLTPGYNYSWLIADVPKTSQAKLEQAIPFSLEDQLLSDAEESHFVVLPPFTPPQSVLVTSKKYLQNCLDQFAGFSISALLPDSALIEAIPNTWRVWLENDICHLVLDEQHRYSCEPDNVDDFLLQCLQDETLAEPQKILVENHQTSLKSLKIADILPEKLEIIDIEEPAFTRLIKQYNNKTINCLQKEFKVQDKESARPRWRLAGLSVAVAAIILVGTELAGLWHMQQILDGQNAQIAAIYHRLFPNAQTVISPRVRIERALRQGAAGNAVFQGYVSSISPLLKKEPEIKVESLRFQSDTLTLRMSAKELASIQQLLLQLRNRFKVTLSNTNTSKDRTQTDMIISQKG